MKKYIRTAKSKFQKIESDYTYYNANPKLNNTNDCTVRAMSLAFGENYDDIHKYMIGHYGKNFRQQNNFGIAVEDLGGQQIVPLEEHSPGEFADSHQYGSYVLEVQKENKGHACCVLNGVLYDTFDSSAWPLKRAWVTSDEDISFENYSETEIVDEISDTVRDTYLKFFNKAPYMAIRQNIGKFNAENQLVYRVHLMAYIPDNNDNIEKTFWDEVLDRKDFYVNFNPRKSKKENLTYSLKKLRDNIRDWLSKVRREFEETYLS